MQYKTPGELESSHYNVLSNDKTYQTGLFLRGLHSTSTNECFY